jgi:hypothetical protein
LTPFIDLTLHLLALATSVNEHPAKRTFCPNNIFINHPLYTMVGTDVPVLAEAQQPLTTYSINHEATENLDSTNAFEGMNCHFCCDNVHMLTVH